MSRVVLMRAWAYLEIDFERTFFPPKSFFECFCARAIQTQVRCVVDMLQRAARLRRWFVVANTPVARA